MGRGEVGIGGVSSGGTEGIGVNKRERGPTMAKL